MVLFSSQLFWMSWPVPLFALSLVFFYRCFCFILSQGPKKKKKIFFFIKSLDEVAPGWCFLQEADVLLFLLPIIHKEYTIEAWDTVWVEYFKQNERYLVIYLDSGQEFRPLGPVETARGAKAERFWGREISQTDVCGCEGKQGWNDRGSSSLSLRCGTVLLRFCKSSIFSCRLYGMRKACAVIFMSGTITRECSDEILVV